MYRAVWHVFRILDRNPEYFVPSWLDDLELSLNEDGEICHKWEGLEKYIRTSEASLHASVCATIPEVREYLQKFQKEVVKEWWWVAEWRDIGYAVMPDAAVKFFMTASVEERAKRRQKDYEAKWIHKSLEEVETMIKERDHRDMNRDHTPLKQLPDAIVVDTSDMTFEQQVSKMEEHVLGHSITHL